VSEGFFQQPAAAMWAGRVLPNSADDQQPSAAMWAGRVLPNSADDQQPSAGESRAA